VTASAVPTVLALRILRIHSVHDRCRSWSVLSPTPTTRVTTTLLQVRRLNDRCRWVLWY